MNLTHGCDRRQKIGRTMKQAERARALDEIYVLLHRHAKAAGGPRRLGDCSARDGWPSHGVYVFYEAGETREDGLTPRIVRVGTHALTATSRTKLWNRLRTHRGAVGGSRAGGGNHRRSVFRRHVGNALIARGDATDPSATWGRRKDVPRNVKNREHSIEQAVSRHLGDMAVLWIEVREWADRAALERGLIALLSNADRPAVDPPSPGWLGRHSPHSAITSSGLWTVDHVHAEPDDATLPLLHRILQT